MPPPEWSSNHVKRQFYICRGCYMPAPEWSSIWTVRSSDWCRSLPCELAQYAYEVLALKGVTSLFEPTLWYMVLGNLPDSYKGKRFICTGEKMEIIMVMTIVKKELPTGILDWLNALSGCSQPIKTTHTHNNTLHTHTHTHQSVTLKIPSTRA